MSECHSIWPNKTIQRQDGYSAKLELFLPLSPSSSLWYLFIAVSLLPAHNMISKSPKSVIRIVFLKCKSDHVTPLPRIFPIGHRMKSFSLCMAKKDFDDLDPLCPRLIPLSSPLPIAIYILWHLNEFPQNRIVLLMAISVPLHTQPPPLE